jgi:hypothetical protein
MQRSNNKKSLGRPAATPQQTKPSENREQENQRFATIRDFVISICNSRGKIPGTLLNKAEAARDAIADLVEDPGDKTKQNEYLAKIWHCVLSAYQSPEQIPLVLRAESRKVSDMMKHLLGEQRMVQLYQTQYWQTVR